MDLSEINVRRGKVVDAAMRIHGALGPGVLEGAYEACLAHELRKRGCLVRVQAALPILYDGVHIELGYRVDSIVDDALIVELKAVTKPLPVHEAQLLSYLRLSGYRVGLLINFHERHLQDGIRRMIGGW